jgi:hypothetical protein
VEDNRKAASPTRSYAHQGIPSIIGGMNQLTGQIPISFSCLGSVEHLNLAGNRPGMFLTLSATSTARHRSRTAYWTGPTESASFVTQAPVKKKCLVGNWTPARGYLNLVVVTLPPCPLPPLET